MQSLWLLIASNDHHHFASTALNILKNDMLFISIVCACVRVCEIECGFTPPNWIFLKRKDWENVWCALSVVVVGFCVALQTIGHFLSPLSHTINEHDSFHFLPLFCPASSTLLSLSYALVHNFRSNKGRQSERERVRQINPLSFGHCWELCSVFNIFFRPENAASNAMSPKWNNVRS